MSINQGKVGTFLGVFVPNVTMMIGIILFLRIGVISSHAGPTTMLLVIFFSLVIMFITSASIASIATNMDVGSGGIYYLITRSLGIEIGGALGLATYLSQILSICLSISGFAYCISKDLPNIEVNTLEIIILVIATTLSSYSSKLVLNCQVVILFIIFVAISAIFFGSIDNLPYLNNNLTPFYDTGMLTFWSAFALFYPAMTGIEAGMALSGKLKNPGKSLLIGNFFSLLFTAIIFGIIAIGSLNIIPYEYLKHEPFALVQYSNYSEIVTIGILVATLSSALGSLLGAPRMLQSMADDGIIFSFLGKTYGKQEEPRLSLLITFILVLCINSLTTIDNIIPALTMICLINYGLLNLISGLATWMNSPSWRPAFRFHCSIAFLGFFLCILTMFMISAFGSIIAIFSVFLLYMILRQVEVDVNFHDFRNSIVFYLSRMALYKLANSEEQALNWHPKLLILTVAPSSHAKAIHLANSFTRQSGLLTVASVIPEEWQYSSEKQQLTIEAIDSFFNKQNISSLIEIIGAPRPYDGYINLIKSYGIGHIQPNTIVLPIENIQAIDEKVIEIIDICKICKKNIILFLDSEHVSDKIFSRRLIRTTRKINIDWNMESNESFDLIVSLVSILRDSRKWVNSICTINAYSEDPNAQESITKFLKDFIEKARLNMNYKVFKHQQQMFSNLSQVHVSMIPLRKLQDDELHSNYLSYLTNILASTNNKSINMFVCSYDEISHNEIVLPS